MGGLFVAIRTASVAVESGEGSHLLLGHQPGNAVGFVQAARRGDFSVRLTIYGFLFMDKMQKEK